MTRKLLFLAGLIFAVPTAHADGPEVSPEMLATTTADAHGLVFAV